jgi:hypothetical protein
MNYDPNFVITFQPNETYADFLHWFTSRYASFDWQGADFASTSGNYVRIQKNPLHADRIEESKQELEYQLEIIHWRENAFDAEVMKKQADLAREFVQDFKDRGYLVEFDAPDIEAFM